MSHVLVVGGTGMLRDVTLHLVDQGHTVSVVARSYNRLQDLVLVTEGLSGALNPLMFDYRLPADLRDEIEEAIATFGPITTAVCWIHSQATQTPVELGSLLNGSGSTCRYFDLLGSMSIDPRRLLAERRLQIEQYRNVRYYAVMLGFMNDRGRNRWLTDTEICDGVLAALDRPRPETVIGTLDPWPSRPQ